MRVLDVFNGMARCISFDSFGRVRQRFFYTDHLTPLWLSLQPRSLWPDAGQLDMLLIEQEEREAAAARRACRRAARKAKRSNKLTRKVPA